MARMNVRVDRRESAEGTGTRDSGDGKTEVPRSERKLRREDFETSLLCILSEEIGLDEDLYE